MKLTVIVPVYNMAEGNRLTFCLDSLINQTYKDMLILAVDDKSTDNSLEILREYEKKYPDKIKVIASPENRRQGGAKNLGLRNADSEWIGFVDSDDWVNPEFYEKLMNKAEQTGADVVGCDVTVVNSQTYEVGEVQKCNDVSQTGILDSDKYASLIMDTGYMVSRIYKRSIFDDNGLWFPERMSYEDNCLGPLVMLYAKRFEYIDEPLYYYYQHGTSTTHSIDIKKCTDRLTVMEYFMDECYKREFFEEYPLEIEFRFISLFYVNTLFSYCINLSFFKQRLSFIKMLRDGIMMNFPDFDTNPYFEEHYDDEVKRLTGLHTRKPFIFMIYYSLLKTYRRIRYKQ